MKFYNKGNTFLEVIIVIGIIVAISFVVLPSLSNFRDQQSLKNTTEDIVSILNLARANTLSSLNSNYYSVHLESDKVTYFVGGTYTSGLSTNKVINFDTNVTLPSANINLNASSTDVTFDRLTGNTSDYGTITIQLTKDSSKQKVITVSKTGLVSSN